MAPESPGGGAGLGGLCPKSGRGLAFRALLPPTCLSVWTSVSASTRKLTLRLFFWEQLCRCRGNKHKTAAWLSFSSCSSLFLITDLFIATLGVVRHQLITSPPGPELEKPQRVLFFFLFGLRGEEVQQRGATQNLAAAKVAHTQFTEATLIFPVGA